MLDVLLVELHVALYLLELGLEVLLDVVFGLDVDVGGLDLHVDAGDLLLDPVFI